MKTSVRSFVCAIIFSSLFTSNIQAQSSCPVINNSSFQVYTDGPNPCNRKATFTFYNPTNGAKRIRVTILVGSTVVINECVDASGQVNVTRTFTSSNFNACSLANVQVQITPFTGSSCNNSSCAPTSISVAGAPLSNSTLPVSFSSFTTARAGHTVKLNWETSTEINNTGFAVERNTNGSWEQIGFVPTVAINGNSSEKLQYQFTDINSSKSVSQYRLKQIDFNGTFDYSAIRAINGMGQDAKTIVYPNPSVNGKMTVVFADAAVRDIIIADMAGRVIKQWSGYNGNSIEITGLSTGMFSLQVYNRETASRSSEKLMVAGK